MVAVQHAAASQIQAASRGLTVRRGGTEQRSQEVKRTYEWLRPAFKQADLDSDGLLNQEQLQRLITALPDTELATFGDAAQISTRPELDFETLCKLSERFLHQEGIAAEEEEVDVNSEVSWVTVSEGGEASSSGLTRGKDGGAVCLRALARTFGVEGLMRLEWERTCDAFNDADINKDGAISLDEQMALFTKQGVDVNVKRTADFIRQQFRFIDTDGDGQVSRREYLTAAGLPTHWIALAKEPTWSASHHSSSSAQSESDSQVQVEVRAMEMEVRTITMSVGVEADMKTSADVDADADEVEAAREMNRGAVKVQSLARARRDRKMLVKQLNDSGTLLAMPGTVQGRSGWYEYGDQSLEYEVSSGGEWLQVRGPMSRLEWKQTTRAEHTATLAKRDVAADAAKEAAAAGANVSMAMAAIKAATKLQSLIRARRDRKRMCNRINELGALLALPGTIQGRSGWYEYQGTALQYSVSKNAGEEEQWNQIGQQLTIMQWKQHNRQQRK